MKLALATQTPEVDPPPPVALLSGTFPERMAKARDLGYDGVELMVARPQQVDAASLLDAVRRAGLEVAAIASGPIFMLDQITLVSASAEISRQASQRLTGLVDLAARMEAPLVTIGSFRGKLAWAGDPMARSRLLEMIREAADYAARSGVRLVIEPLNRYETDIIRNAGEGLAFLAELDHPDVGLLLDTFHMNIEEADTAAALIEVWQAGRLWHIHLGDSNRLPPGSGHFDFAALVRCLTALGYQGYLSAELLSLPDPDTAAVQTITALRRLLPD